MRVRDHPFIRDRHSDEARDLAVRAFTAWDWPGDPLDVIETAIGWSWTATRERSKSEKK